MNHLLAALIRHGDVPTLVRIATADFAVCLLAFRFLLRSRDATFRPIKAVLAFAGLITACSWLGFRIAVVAWFPTLTLHCGAAWTFAGIALTFAGASAAATVQVRTRRSARNALTAGSILACGLSCSLFTNMAGIASPYALAYDLGAVLISMVIGSGLCGFAFWECDNQARRHRELLAVALTAAAMTWLSFASIGAILPFSGWMATISHPDDLASSPIAIIVTAEAAAVLVFCLSGSLVDNRVAARDRQEAERMREMADSAFEAILIHRGGIVLAGNQSASALLEVDFETMCGTRLDSFVDAACSASATGTERRGRPGETEIVTSSGGRVPVEILSRTIAFNGGPAVATALRDIRERRASEQRISFLAHHDVLTELPNRALLSETLQLILDPANDNFAPVAVFCLDLDGFKAVNDTLGHAAGDLLLRGVAARLRDNVRATDLVSRVGGDEFVLLQIGAATPEALGAYACRVIEHLSQPFDIDGQQVQIGTSIGIAISPDHGSNVSELLRHADIALYRAKAGGRGVHCMFDPGMAADLRERRELELELREAVAHDLLALEYQPLFNLDREPIAVEALARWNHPRLGMVPPSKFIPIAEESGLIGALGEWVLRTACREAVTWRSECRVAVNLSPAQFRSGTIPDLTARILRETGLEPNRLELEITEGMLIDDTEEALGTLQALRALGVRIVLDDFGTGYSSLSYLHKFPFDKIKVDRSFVQRLEGDADVRAIVSAIIAMSRTLKLDVTAEGVETLAQFDLLAAQGCDELQGYLLSRPLAQAALRPFLAGCDRQPVPDQPPVEPALGMFAQRPLPMLAARWLGDGDELCNA